MDWGDGQPPDYYGNYDSCKIRNDQLQIEDMKPFDYNLKTIEVEKIYP